jgi:hypothetical protein
MALTLTVPIIDLYFDDDGIRTETSQAQEVVEGNVEAVFEEPRKTANYRQQCVTRILVFGRQTKLRILSQGISAYRNAPGIT